MVNRRNFLKLGAAAVAGTSVVVPKQVNAQETELELTGGMDYSYRSGSERDAVPTACAMCPSRCAAIAYKENGYVVKIEGHPESQRTLGVMCAKGQAGVTQIYDPDRILRPLRRVGKRGEGNWKQISWDEALEELSTRLQKLRDDGEPEKFMFSHGWISASADKLINKVFLPTYGTGTVANSSCLGQRVTAHKLTWGATYDSWDFDNTRYILNFGSNVVEAHTDHVALARRLAVALTDRNLKMVTFDVRLSNTAAKSHQWVQLKPGTDVAVVLAMCHVIMNEELYKGAGEEFLMFCQVTPDPVASLEDKIAALKAHLEPYTPEWAEEISGADAGLIRTTAIEFSQARPGCIISSRGATAQYNGVDAERAIQMLAAITGNIDNPGGRCVAIIPEWTYPTGPEEKPELRSLDILHGFEGDAALPIHVANHEVLHRIKDGSGGRPDVFMWYNYNPVFSNANSLQNMEILKDESLIPFTVAVTPFYDESSSLADLILPDTVYLEQFDFEDGISPTQIPEYYIRQPVVDPQGEARDFKDVCCELADRMGFNLGIESGEDFVEQACGLTEEVENNAGGFYSMQEMGVWQNPDTQPIYQTYATKTELSALQQDAVIFDEDTGVYWNWKLAGVEDENQARSAGYRGTPGAYQGYVAQKFWDAVYTGFKPDLVNKSGFFELYSSILEDKGLAPLPVYTPIPEHQDLKEDEMILTTFRVNVQTLSRTQNCYWLDEITTDNPAWINTKTAAMRNIVEGDRIKMKSHLGEIEATVKVTENVVPGVVAITSHGGRWEYGRSASGKKAPFGREETSQYEELKWWKTEGVHPNLIIDKIGEPVSGQQRWMDTVVTVSKA